MKKQHFFLFGALVFLGVAVAWNCGWRSGVSGPHEISEGSEGVVGFLKTAKSGAGEPEILQLPEGIEGRNRWEREELGVIRMGRVALDETMWEQGFRLAREVPGVEIRVDFPADGRGVRTAIFDHGSILSEEDGSQQWTGRVEGIPYSSAILTRWKGEVYAAIHAGELGQYEWREDRDGEMAAFRFDHATMPACGVDDRQGVDGDGLADNPETHMSSGMGDADADGLFPASTGANVITIVVGYNAQALAAVPAIEAKILTSVTGSNQTYANSGIDLQLRLCWMGKVDYIYDVESTFTVALAQVRDIDDGNADLLAAKRAEYGADFGSLWLANNVTGGLASVLTSVNPAFAYSVVRAQNAPDTMTHEVGHNQGCRHHRASYMSTPSVWEADAFGHKFVGTNGTTYGTVMVNSNDLSGGGVRIQYFANPAVSYQGVPTGVLGDEDTSRCLMEHAIDYEGLLQTVPAKSSITAVPALGSVTANLTVERAFVGEQYQIVRASSPGEAGLVLDTVSTNSEGTATFQDANVVLPRAFYWWREP